MKSFSRQHFVREDALLLFFSSSIDKIKSINLMMLLTIMAFFVILTLNGCSGSGVGGTPAPASPGGSNDTADPVDPVDPYVGAAKISGTVKLSSLTSSDSSQIDAGASPRMASFRSKAINTETEAVKLYVVGEGGELVDTGISCSLTEDEDDDRAYECDGIKDGVNYIVRYVQITDNGKALEMKASAFVPEGDTQPEAAVEVTPQSSVVAEALVSAILSATAGAEIDDDVVNNIIESVKSAIVTLVTDGAIQIPSMVVEVADGSELADVVGSETENEKLDNAAGLLLADESVDTELGIIAADTQASQFDMSAINTAEEKEAFIKKVFKDLLSDDEGGSEDMGDVFFGFFTWLYLNDQTKPAGGILDAVIGSIDYARDDTDQIIAGNTDDVTADNAISAFSTYLTNMNTLLDQNPDDLSAAEKEELADFPPIIRGLFPSTTGTITSVTQLNVPQSIALIIYFEDIFMNDTLLIDDSSTVDDSGKISTDDRDIYDWDDKALFEYLGIIAYASANPTLFSGIEIFGLYLHPGSVWINDPTTGYGEEFEALMGGTDIMNLAGFLDDSINENINAGSGATVTLTYPKRLGGMGSIGLVYMTHGDDPEGYWGIDPWRESDIAGTPGDIDSNRVVSDFTSGTYTITVTYNGTTIAKSFEKKVITGMTDKYAKITTPRGMPNWLPGDATDDEIDANNTAWNLFNSSGGITTFTANVMSDGSVPGEGVEPTNAKITVSWEPPDVVLPDGVKMVYDMSIGIEGECVDMSCPWEEIWNTWEENKRIYTTSFTIPHWFEKTMDKPYHLNIGVNFINQATGEYLGQGGRAHTEFRVGDPIDPDAMFTIKGLNTITLSETDAELRAVLAAKLKIALIKETSDGESFTKTIVEIAPINGETGYNLDLQIGDFLNTSNANTWYNLILIEEEDDGNPDNDLSAGDPLGMVPTYWPDYSSGGMWFDTWGGILKIGTDTCTSTGECVHEETVIIGEEIIDGPKFYIGVDMYEPPSAVDVLPVPASVLAQTFTITGNVDTSGPTTLYNPQVVLVEEGYDSLLDMHVQKVVSVGDISGGTYSIETTIAEFFDGAGKPTDKWFQIILVDAYNMDDDPPTVDLPVDSVIGYLPMWWPDWSNGGFGFDTWRGEKLVIYTDTYDSGPGTWTHTEVENPDDTDTVTGPDLSNIDYVATAPSP